MSMRWKSAAFAVMLAAAQTGCSQETSTEAGTAEPATSGSATESASTAGALDPCSLMTQAEAEALLGGAVEGPSRDSGFGQFAQCQYIASGERIADTGSVTIQVQAIDLGSWRKAFADAGNETEPVSDISEDAFWVPDYGTLYVQKGKFTAAFSVHKAGVDPLSAAKDLAAKGVARLPR